MDQRVSFVTLAVADVARSHRFYIDGLGWEPELYVPGEVLMIRAAEKVVLSLWSAQEFEEEVGPINRGDGVAPITLSHNVATDAEVDEILDLARSLGVEASAGRAPYLGRLHRLLLRPRRLPVGDRNEPGPPARRHRPALGGSAAGAGVEDDLELEQVGTEWRQGWSARRHGRQRRRCRARTRRPRRPPTG